MVQNSTKDVVEKGLFEGSIPIYVYYHYFTAIDLKKINVKNM